MGELFAVASMTFFALTNIAVVRGHDGKSKSSGAFLSILITFLLAFVIWLVTAARDGWPPVNREAMTWFAGSGVLTIFIGRVFVYASIQHLGAIRASAVKRLNPFFAVLLGVLVLGESVSGSMMIGMLLILSSFVVLVRQAVFMAEDDPSAPKQSAFDRFVNLGYVYGPVSALAYATGYIARKQGMTLQPDAALGTALGAITGIVCFLIASGFIRTYREDLVRTFTTFNPWFLFAGVLSSLGQIAYFAALEYIGISKIALIVSMEVFMTMFLSTVLFLSKEKLTPDVIIAAILGFLGTAVIILF